MYNLSAHGRRNSKGRHLVSSYASSADCCLVCRNQSPVQPCLLLQQTLAASKSLPVGRFSCPPTSVIAFGHSLGNNPSTVFGPKTAPNGPHRGPMAPGHAPEGSGGHMLGRNTLGLRVGCLLVMVCLFLLEVVGSGGGRGGQGCLRGTTPFALFQPLFDPKIGHSKGLWGQTEPRGRPNSLKTGRECEFEHPKWPRVIFEKKRFQSFWDPFSVPKWAVRGQTVPHNGPKRGRKSTKTCL